MLAHEALDPPNTHLKNEEKAKSLYLQSFFYGITMYLVITSNLLLNVRHLFSLAMCVTYGAVVESLIYASQDHQDLVIPYFGNNILILVIFIMIFYFQEKDSKLLFLKE